jgi:hypothetical protein
MIAMASRVPRILLPFLGLLFACQGVDRDAELPALDDGTSAGLGESDPPDPDETTAGGDKLDLGGGTDDGVGFGNEEGCASFSETAKIHKRPADIIVVVDNSPSMVQEADEVQARLNAFSQQIVAAGIDMRVLLLTAYPNPNVAPSIDTGICIDPPLGGGGCPGSDDNQPLFAHLHENIGSSHSLQKVLDTQPTWASMMRDGSSKHIIVVSDDDSYLSAADFDEQFRAFDPSYADYSLHGIVSMSPCVFADTLGEQYIELANMTDGVLGDLCDQEFQPVFDLLSTAVQEGSSLDCEWALPEAPLGHEIDPATVEVLLEVNGAPLAATRVESLAACSDIMHGWHYDDPADPSLLVACPQTCAALRLATEAELEIDVGCAQPPVG